MKFSIHLQICRGRKFDCFSKVVRFWSEMCRIPLGSQEFSPRKFRHGRFPPIPV